MGDNQSWIKQYKHVLRAPSEVGGGEGGTTEYWTIAFKEFHIHRQGLAAYSKSGNLKIILSALLYYTQSASFMLYVSQDVVGYVR